MTKDFRNVGRLPDRQAETPAASHRVGPAQPTQRIVLLAIGFAALGFFAAGIWLLRGGPSPFPTETAHLVGIAFVISAIADLGIIFFLKHFWSKSQ